MAVDFRELLVAFLTLCIGFVSTRTMRRTLSRFRSREQKAGKELIYRHFPRHKKPLGGGVAIFLALVAGVLLALPIVHFATPGERGVLWVWLACGLAFGAIGAIDDWRKVNAAHGLSEVAKIALQILLALIFTITIVSIRPGGTDVFIPFLGWTELGYLFLPFGMVVIIGASNAVNLTDGLDGLAGSSLAIAFAGYLALAALLHHAHIPTIIPLLALAALGGFLFYNRPPARIIMGDTGALGLGAALGALALLSRTEWLLLLFAAPFVIDTVSVVIQMSVIRFFRGPVKLLRHQTTEIFRPFLCTPLHHHFQWLTWGPWPILALFNGVAVFAGVLGLLALPATDGAMGFAWFWSIGVLAQVSFLAFAALQKVVRANYFLGLERPDGGQERMLALFKGLPIEFVGMRGYTVEELTIISEGMLTSIAAESILWRNISEIEARATLGKIYAEYKMFDRAAEEWEEIPTRNLLIRENIVVQLGKIYYGRDELLRAIKLWEQLPPARLARVTGLPETIQSGKVRIGHLAGRLYHQARDHATALRAAAEMRGRRLTMTELTATTTELEAAQRYTQDLRDLLAYEQQKTEVDPDTAQEAEALYRRMDAMLAARRDELHNALLWAQEVAHPEEVITADAPMPDLADALQMTPAEFRRAISAGEGVTAVAVAHLTKPSRNTLFRITLDGQDARNPASLIAKCFRDESVAFFAACYRRERGVLQILNETGAPAPRCYGGHLGARQAVLFLEDLAGQGLAHTLCALAPDDRAGRMLLLRRGVETLVRLRRHSLPVLPQLEREIGKIVKEVLTPEYYLNTMAIALTRILSLERRQLNAVERGRLEVALHPLLAVLLAEPRTFIHFEFTPGNLLVRETDIIAVDFEQATIGPAAFDLATLLYAPEAGRHGDDIETLIAYYHELLPADDAAGLAIHRPALEAAAIIKSLFYAGSAANFYRKFDEKDRLDALVWYVSTAERLLARTPAYADLAAFIADHCGDSWVRRKYAYPV